MPKAGGNKQQDKKDKKSAEKKIEDKSTLTLFLCSSLLPSRFSRSSACASFCRSLRLTVRFWLRFRVAFPTPGSRSLTLTDSRVTLSFPSICSNKNKSAKVQQYVKQVEQSVKSSSGKAAKQQEEKKKAKEAAESAKSELMPATIKQPKVPEGMDPKTVVCEYWRHNCCAKGNKCKFAHDFNVQQRRREQERNNKNDDSEASEQETRLLHKGGPDLYTDYRDFCNNDGSSSSSKTASTAGSGESSIATTSKICTHFLHAVESGFYGWRWQCPTEKSGERCKYKHCLPIGYKLQSDIKALAAEEKENKRSLEEEIEEKRNAIDNATPVTEVVFMEWYKRKRAERDKKKREELEERRKHGRLTGREIIQSGSAEAWQDDENAQSKDEEHRERKEQNAPAQEDSSTVENDEQHHHQQDDDDTTTSNAGDKQDDETQQSLDVQDVGDDQA